MLKKIFEFEFTEQFEAEASQLFVIFSDAERWPADSIARVLVVRSPGYVQVAFEDRSRATIEVSSLGSGKCQVNVKHELLADAEASKIQKKAWKRYIGVLRKQVER
jgi:hypothetical protein